MFIGYEGYAPGNIGIADRRRTLFWGSKRGHTIVDSRDPRADVIVLTSSSDLGFWGNTKTSKPLVLDVVDGLIGEQSPAKDFLRGYAYWATGNSSSTLPSNYRKLLLAVATKSKTVVCSSPEQVREWAKYGIKAIDILDIHDEIELSPKTQPITQSDTNEIFWEGLPPTLGSVCVLQSFFESNIKKSYKLNILTNLNSYKYMNKFKKVNLQKLVSKQLNSTNIEIRIIEWSPKELLNYSASSTLGVIPIQASEGYNHLKAENRLLIMWRLGLPVLTSPLESYVRTMRDAGIDGVCNDENDWNTKLRNLFHSSDLRAEFQEKASIYLREHHDSELLLSKWDAAIVK
jgi:hypothetical protein